MPIPSAGEPRSGGSTGSSSSSSSSSGSSGPSAGNAAGIHFAAAALTLAGAGAGFGVGAGWGSGPQSCTFGGFYFGWVAPASTANRPGLMLTYVLPVPPGTSPCLGFPVRARGFGSFYKTLPFGDLVAGEPGTELRHLLRAPRCPPRAGCPTREGLSTAGAGGPGSFVAPDEAWEAVKAPPVPCRPRTAAPTPTHTLCGRGCGTTKLYGSPRARGDESQGWFPLVKPTPNARAVPCPGRGGDSPFPLSLPQAHFRLSTFPIFLPSPSLRLRSPSRARSRGVGGAEEADPGPRIIFFRQPLG